YATDPRTVPDALEQPGPTRDVGQESHQMSEVVPSATSTAGPASSTSRPGNNRTRRVPPGTSTVTCPAASTSPDQNARPIAAAHTPVPQERVSPTPRSCTRIEMCPGPST